MEDSRFTTTSVPPDEPVTSFDGLRRTGFARARAEDLGFPADRWPEHFRRITDAFADLPPDPYAKNTNRFRRYSRLVYLPWSGDLFWVPGMPDPEYGSVTEYDQNGFNPEFSAPRRFPHIPMEVRNNPLLEQIIRADLGEVRWLEALAWTPVYVGVHMVKLAVRHPGDVAFSSPNCLHRDGGDMMFTFVHLVRCHNVVGGENIVADPECAGKQPEDLQPCDIHARFTLAEPLETYAVHDHRVSHYVSPVRMGERADHGERDIFIVGLAPFVPRF